MVILHLCVYKYHTNHSLASQNFYILIVTCYVFF
uniref:Uncharacterized protein n=1 Tax=Anguilla anguilla TaxID=7936 RepID=A0A0E9TBZ8_ANGAN